MNERPIAFPGAEGFGKYTEGGRGGKVYIVDNLNDEGAGSFRDAVSSKEKRVVVFSVSGTIHLLSPLTILGNKTIAGQTAPGDGICLADHPVRIGGDQVIIRYMRFRMGDRYQGLKGKVPGSGSDDAFSAGKRKHIIIDHCSMSWSTDEVCSVYGGDSTTLQWNIISEPLNYSYHFEEGDKDWENHGYGGIWGGSHFTGHHNLFAHCISRNPRFNGARLGANDELADFRNNVIYNWVQNTVYGGEGGHYNIVANYYKPGPSTGKNVKNRIANPGRTEEIPFGKWFISGNVVDGNQEVSNDNLKGVVLDNKATQDDRHLCIIDQPHQVEDIPGENALIAYQNVLAKAGASFRRDTLDERIINDVKNGTGKIIDVQGGYPHGTTWEVSKTAWPVLKQTQPLPDADKDGMPDEWEKKNGLDPTKPEDASLKAPKSFYTNIERFIHSITL
ncbi:MAG: pectate lyase [Chitinophagaceae bacterium]|nr:pectate lyase [Chitinophagaceae bacterium]